MFDLNTLFSTAGTAGMTGGMGGATPDFLAQAGGAGDMMGFADLLGSIDPKVLAQIGQMGAQPGQTQARPAASGPAAPLRAGQIQDTTAATAKQAQASQDVGPRRGFGQLIYGR